MKFKSLKEKVDYIRKNSKSPKSYVAVVDTGLKDDEGRVIRNPSIEKDGHPRVRLVPPTGVVQAGYSGFTEFVDAAKPKAVKKAADPKEAAKTEG